MKLSIFTSLCMLFLCVQNAYAELKFTEIYPAPEKNNFEWVEVFNDGTEPIDATSYSIFDLTGNNLQLQSLIIQPQEYAIATASSVINNAGDSLFLKSSTGIVVNTVTTPKDITSQQSFVLCGSDWKITEKITQKGSNEAGCLQPTPTTSQSNDTPSTTPASTPTHILISEANVYPEKNSVEWVEIYNDSDETADLINWFIDDGTTGSQPFKFSAQIPPRSYSIVELSTSIFNNDADDIRLLNTAGSVVDQFSYASSKQGLSVSNIGQNRSCTTEITRLKTNSSCREDETTEQIESENSELAHTTLYTQNATPKPKTEVDIKVPTQPTLTRSKPNEAYMGKTYSLEKIPEPPFMKSVRIALFCSLLSCVLNLMYSMYRYKDLCVSLFTIGSQHSPG